MKERHLAYLKEGIRHLPFHYEVHYVIELAITVCLFSV